MADNNQTHPKPAARVATQTEDVWSIANDAAAKSPIQPVVNMGQGFFGYNPPDFIIEAAQEAVTRVDANQYSPSQGRPRLRRALAAAYGAALNRTIDPATEVVVTTGANEGILSAFMAFVERGDEVIVIEPFFDQYISNIEMAGGVVRYAALVPPPDGDTATTSSGDWRLDMDALAAAVTPRTRMLVLNSPHNPVGKVFSRAELAAVAAICVPRNIIMVSDEVYDSLYYGDAGVRSSDDPAADESDQQQQQQQPPRMAALASPDTWPLTLTVGSAGKTFCATGWRVGYLVGPAHLVRYVAAAHMRICYTSPSPLQEACAVGFEVASRNGFWRDARRGMRAKIRRFAAVCDELGLPYTAPQGGYFVLVNMARVRIPDDYPFPPAVAASSSGEEGGRGRARDFRLAWFLAMELGVAAIPPSEFYRPGSGAVAENYLRFAVCKEDDVLDAAKERLRGLKRWIV